MNKRTYSTLSLWAAACCLIFMFAVQAKAGNSPANLHIVCTGSTVCASGATSLITTSPTPTFNIFQTDGPVSGTAWLAVLVPNGTASFTVNLGASTITLEESINFSSGQLGDSDNLNEPGLSDFEFSALASASSQAPGVTATSFTVYEYPLGSASSGGNSTLVSGLSVGPLPPGSVIVAWVEDGSGNAIDRTPISGSLTVVPEPGSMALFGTGLLLLGGAIRRRWNKHA